MSDLPDAPAVVQPAPAAAVAAADAPIATAPAETASANPSAVVNSVVQSVTGHPAVAAADAPSIIASVLGALYQAEPAIFAVTRASSQTQSKVNLGLGLAEVILGAFLHPAE